MNSKSKIFFENSKDKISERVQSLKSQGSVYILVELCMLNVYYV